MESILRTNLGSVNSKNNAAKMEILSHQIDEMFSRVNELQQSVTAVEQYYTNSKSEQLTPSKSSSIFKHQVVENDLSKKQQQDSLERKAADEKRMQELMRQFAVMFHQITQHKWARPFMQPVDVVGLGLRDYYKVIEKPMDLGTIKNRMESNDGTGYKNVREIYAHVRLVFKNAMKYNDERHNIHVMARTLLQRFEEKWLQLLPRVTEEERRRIGEGKAAKLARKVLQEERRGIEEEQAAQLAMKVSQEVVHSNMVRDLDKELYDTDMHLEELKEILTQQHRKFTTEEKKKLWVALNQLQPRDLFKALEIVAENNPRFQATAEEVDLDINAQSEVTLWKLKAFVHNALKVMGRNSEVMDANINNGSNENEVNNNNEKCKNNANTTTNTNNNRNRNSTKKRTCNDIT